MSTFFSTYPVYGVPIYSSLSTFPASAPTGSLGVAANTGYLYEFNGSSWVVIAGSDAPNLSLGAFGSSPNASAATLSGGVLTLQPADNTHPGGISTGTQTLAGAKTFSTSIASPSVLLNGSISGALTHQTAATTTSYTLTWPSGQGASSTFLKNDGSGGLSWAAGTGGSGVDSIGTIDSQTKSADALVISGTTLYTQTADATHPGMVSTGTQTLAGAKTFSTAPILSSLTASTALVLDGSKNITTLGYTSNNTGSFLVQRDANGNAAFNNVIGTIATIVSAGATTTLSIGSARYQKVTGTQTQTIKLPDATTLIIGWVFEVNNNSTQSVSVVDNANGAVCTVLSGAYTYIVNTNNGSAAGSWDAHFTIPTNSAWGTNSITIGALGTAGLVRTTSGGVLSSAEISGDATTSGSNALTLNTVNSNVGTFASATVNGKGLITAAGNLTGDITSSGAATTLATVNSNVGSFGSSTAIPNFTVNGKGLVTAAGTNAVIAPAGTLTGTTLASNVVTSSLTTVGTIGTGTWQGTTVSVDHGGTGQTSYTDGQLLIGNTTGNTLSKATLTAGSNITITNGHGSITIDASASSNPAYNYTAQTTTYSATISDWVVCSGASFTVTLPTAASQTGKTIIIQHNGTSLTQIYTLNTTSSQTINGPGGTVSSGNYKLYTNGEILQVLSDGSNWQVLEHQAQTSMLSYTPTFTGLGSVSNLFAAYQRRGKMIQVMGIVTAGTTAGSLASITLPGSLNFDTTNIAVNNTTSNPGLVVGDYQATGGNTSCRIVTAAGTSTTVVYVGNQINAVNALVPQNGSTVATTGATLSFNFSLPITEWQP